MNHCHHLRLKVKSPFTQIFLRIIPQRSSAIAPLVAFLQVKLHILISLKQYPYDFMWCIGSGLHVSHPVSTQLKEANNPAKLTFPVTSEVNPGIWRKHSLIEEEWLYLDICIYNHSHIDSLKKCVYLMWKYPIPFAHSTSLFSLLSPLNWDLTEPYPG